MAVIQNINEKFGDSVTFEADTVEEAVKDMLCALENCFCVSFDLKEDRDYTVLED